METEWLPWNRPMRTRDPARTRRAILAAARDEFARHGPAGARVDRVAAEAGVNKRMLYHYFGNKDGLWDAVLAAEVLADGGGAAAGAVRQRLVAGARQLGANPAITRLLGWEALDRRGGDVVAGGSRAAVWRARVAQLARAQQDGVVDGRIDADQLTLALLALQLMPHAFPQLTRLITGHAATSPEFVAAQTRLFDVLARWLSGSAPEPVTEADGPPAPKPRLRRPGSVTRSD
jgi:AcrR family transcriptional regulator